MKVLVTGGCGFIGHRLVNMLEHAGKEVLVVDNHTTYGSVAQKELTNLIDERSKDFSSRIVNIDICNFAALYKAFDEFDPDVVIHLASFPRQKSVSVNPQEGAKTMMEGLINVLELSKNRRLVYIFNKTSFINAIH